MIVKTKEFEACKRILEFFLDGEDLYDEITNPEFSFYENLYLPFTKELKWNLVNVHNTEGKEFLIRYYIWELRQINEEYIEFDELSFKGKKYSEREYSCFTNCISLLKLLLEEIQSECYKYDINLEDLCHKLKFDIWFFNFDQLLYRGSNLGFDLSVDLKKTPNSFNDIFTTKDWRQYINALFLIDTPIINSNYEFIGNKKRDKGVIGGWIYELQSKGIISKKYNRQTLAAVLNNEIKGLVMGEDGKTIANDYPLYKTDFRNKLLKEAKLIT